MNVESNRSIHLEVTAHLTVTGTLTITGRDLERILARPQAMAPTPKTVEITPLPLPAQSEGGLPRLAFTMKETAEILGVSYITVHRLLQRGLLKSSKALRCKIVSRKEIERFLNETSKSVF